MTTDEDAPRWLRTVLILALAAFFVYVVVTVVLADPAPDEPDTVTIPDLVGLTLAEAAQELPDEALEGVDALRQERDLSPEDRLVRAADPDWTVAATFPRAGNSLGAGDELFVYALQNSEWDWFGKHPRMPAIPKHTSWGEVTGKGGLLRGVEDLLLPAYPARFKQQGSPFARLSRRTPHRPPMGSEPSQERMARAHLWEGSGFDKDRTTGESIPPAGAEVRTGRYLVVVVQPYVPPPASR